MTFACACSAAFLWSSYIVPETANVSLEEIDTIFNSSAAREDLQRKFEVRHIVPPTYSALTIDITSLNLNWEYMS